MSSVNFDDIPCILEKTYNKVESLEYICIEKIVESYNGGPMPFCFNKFHKIMFADLLDIDLPMDQVVHLDVRNKCTQLGACKIIIISTFYSHLE